MKKFLAMLLCAMMVLSTFAGCAGDAGESKTETSKTETSKTETSKTESKTDGADKAEPKTIVISVFDRGTTTDEFGTVTDNAYVDWVNEQFGTPNNINVTYYSIPRSEEVAKLNALLAAKEKVDNVITYTSALMYDYADKGGLAPLKQHIEDYGANLKEWLATSLPYGNYKGDTYAIFARRTAIDVTGHYIRKDWLDELGITMRTTADGYYTMSVDELWDALGKFAANDLDNTGAEIFAMGMCGVGSQDRTIAGVYQSFVNNAECTAEDIACVPTMFLPGAKEGFRWLNNAYLAGYMDPDYGTQVDATIMNQYIATGRTGYWTHDSWHEVSLNGTLDTLKTNIPDAEVVAFILENVHGEMFQQIYAPTAILNMVPAWSECPEGVVQYLDWMCIPENAQVLMYGFNYEMVDGVPTNTLENKLYANVSDYALVYNGNPDFDTNVAATVAALSEFCAPIRETTLKTAIIDGVSPYQFGNIESATKHSTNLSATMAELRINTIMAAEGTFDQVWDTWYNEYMTLGGEEVIADQRAFYQANN
ncbi:MAG: extracellular solute-binding protein [Firmicutes bacterium]|nr:extracellular solute-binding protein [Bacillota bacterium]